MPDEMSETMDAIERQDSTANAGSNSRADLKTDIAKLEVDIKNAQDASVKSEADAPSHTPVSPEKANESKKVIVFLKKALAKLKEEYNQLDS